MVLDTGSILGAPPSPGRRSRDATPLPADFQFLASLDGQSDLVYFGSEPSLGPVDLPTPDDTFSAFLQLMQQDWDPSYPALDDVPSSTISPVLSGTPTISQTLSQTISPQTISPSTTSPSTISQDSSPAAVPAPRNASGPPAKGRKRPAGRIEAVKKKVRSSTSRSDVLSAPTAPKTTVKRNADGKIAGTMTVFDGGQIVRATPNREQKRATALTRRHGACPRCRQNKFRCDMPENPYQPCGRCIKMVFNLFSDRAHRHRFQPCVRVDILNLQLHRKGPTINNEIGIWVEQKRQLLRYHDNEPHTLFLAQKIGRVLAPPIEVTVSRFEPIAGDRTAYFWTDRSGAFRSFEVSPYFISDPEAARRRIRELVSAERCIYVDALTADSDSVTREVFRQALGHAKSKLVSTALDYWVAARLIEFPWRVVSGGPAIGLERQDEEGHPWRDFAPVTPMMDTQLDDMVIRDLLMPLAADFLQRLKAAIDAQRRENWLDLLLAVFIIMSNVGLALKDMVTHAGWKGLKPGRRGGNITQGIIHACKTMLAYFHFACTGSLPLTLAFDKPDGQGKGSHGLTADQIEFLAFVKRETDRREQRAKWQDLSMYTDVGYWCYQVVCPEWRADFPHGEIDDYREEDFLSSSTT